MTRSKMPTKKQLNIYHGRDADDDECMACGRAHALHRAHIMPRCAGGTDEPDNLHLLCPICHRDSEFFVGEAYDAWFDAAHVNTDWWFTRGKVILKIQKIWAGRGINPQTQEEIRVAIQEFMR